MKLMVRWFISAFALLGADWLIPGIHIDGLGGALIIAVFLGLVNAVIRPVIILLTLPVTVVSLGFFIFVINGALFAFLAVFIGPFTVDTFGSAMLGSLTVSVFSWMGNKLLFEQPHQNTTNTTQKPLSEGNVKIYEQE